MVLSTVILDIVVAAIALLFLYHWITRTSQLPQGVKLPPGPPGKPIIGNIADMPTHHEWETFTEWAGEYGDLVYIKVFGRSMIIVNSLEVAHDLFDKRSSNYSDRFDFPMLTLMGMNWAFSMMRYGPWWRRHRRMFHEGFHATAAVAYNPILTRQARVCLRRLHESPEDFVGHLRHFAGAIIMEIVYGIKVQPKDDRYIEIAEEAMTAAGQAASPGAFLVDVLPILKYVPEWMPGAGFKRKARIWKEPITAMNEVPFAAVKEALRNGTAGPSFMSSLLERLSNQTDAPEDEEEVIRNVGAVAYGAGADTSVAALSMFMLAMTLHPDVQRKAQEELDSVLGNRLPDFGDLESLPYVNALCKEVQRWHPAIPFGVPHGVMQDDVYGDYFIPKESVVFGNAWAILHNEKLFGPKPDEFRPERFLVPGVKNPNEAGSFGFGRRICPGRHTAESSILIAAASILKVFNISPARDSHGNEIPIDSTMAAGFISHPKPFVCSITVRSAAEEGLLEHYDD